MSARKINIFEKFLRSIQRFFMMKNYLRLYGELRRYKNELEYYAKTQTGENTKQDWVETATNLLEEAEYALAKNRIQVGWRCLHAASRMAIYGYSDDKLHQTAIAIQNEASNKFSAWRKKAIDDVLGVKTAVKSSGSFPCSFISSMTGSSVPPGVIPGGTPAGSKSSQGTPGTPGTPGSGSASAPAGSGSIPDSNKVTADSLFVAVTLRDEHFENIHYKITLRRTNLMVLLLFLVAGLVALPLLVKFEVFGTGFGVSWQTLVAVQIFGILGACMSVALTLTGKSIDSDIPDQQIGSFVTWMRPAIGAVAALAAYFLLQAGFLDNIINASLKEKFIPVLAIAFIAGFSERLVIGVIERVAKK